MTVRILSHFAVSPLAICFKRSRPGKDHSYQCDLAQGSPEAHGFSGDTFVNFSQVHGRAYARKTATIRCSADDYELDADSPEELSRADNLRQERRLSGSAERPSSLMYAALSIDMGTNLPDCFGMGGAILSGQGDADETEEDEDGAPAEELHESDRCTGPTT